MTRQTAALLVIAAVEVWAVVTNPAPKPIVIDGDTLRIGDFDVRLTGYDAPEIFHPRCAAELKRGLEAKKALASLLDGRSPELVPCVGNNYGRACGTLPGLAKAMISRGLAIPYECGAVSCPHTPATTWCSI